MDKDSNIYISDTNVIQVFDISGRLAFETEAEAFGIHYSMERKEISVTRNYCGTNELDLIMLEVSYSLDHTDHDSEIFCSQVQSYNYKPRVDEL